MYHKNSQKTKYLYMIFQIIISRGSQCHFTAEFSKKLWFQSDYDEDIPKFLSDETFIMKVDFNLTSHRISKSTSENKFH